MRHRAVQDVLDLCAHTQVQDLVLVAGGQVVFVSYYVSAQNCFSLRCLCRRGKAAAAARVHYGGAVSESKNLQL